MRKGIAVKVIWPRAGVGNGPPPRVARARRRGVASRALLAVLRTLPERRTRSKPVYVSEEYRERVALYAQALETINENYVDSEAIDPQGALQ